jgi:hypothetical protein
MGFVSSCVSVSEVVWFVPDSEATLCRFLAVRDVMSVL